MKYTYTNKRQRHKEHCSRVNPIRQIAPGSTVVKEQDVFVEPPVLLRYVHPPLVEYTHRLNDSSAVRIVFGPGLVAAEGKSACLFILQPN